MLDILASIQLLLVLGVDRTTILACISVTGHEAVCVLKALIDLIPCVTDGPLTLFDRWTHVRAEPSLTRN